MTTLSKLESTHTQQSFSLLNSTIIISRYLHPFTPYCLLPPLPRNLKFPEGRDVTFLAF